MTKHEWIEVQNGNIRKLEESAWAQRRFAEHQKSFPEAHAESMRLAEFWEKWAEEDRERLKRFEEEF